MKTIKVNQPPPLAQRPKCPQCGKALRPRWITIKEQRRGAVAEWEVTLEWKGDYLGYGYFDTLRCTDAFANAVVKSRRAAAP